MNRECLMLVAVFQSGCMETGLKAVDYGAGAPLGEDTGSEGRFSSFEDNDEDTEDSWNNETNDEQPGGESESVDEGDPETGSEEEPPPVDDCDSTSDLVYVIDRSDEALFVFDPESLSFELVGELDCGIFAGSPGSMSVARNGVAYVRYSDNTVYAVDLETMECEETDFEVGSFGAFGMGFATDSSSTWRDTLYIANRHSLASLDTETWSRRLSGGVSSQSELTGNADGELWAILPLEEPAQLARLNKSDAAVEETLYLSGTPDPMDIDAFAFATWGGDFWVFIRTYGMGESSDIYRVSRTGSTTKVANNIGMDVVGAGVSTCAPTE